MTLALVLSLTLCAAPTDAELTRFGQAIAFDFMAGQDGASSRMDLEALVDRSLSGVTLPDGFRKGFIKGLKQGFDQSWRALATEVSNGGTVAYRRNVTLEGQPAVQLRVLYKSGAFNFVEFMVAKGATGELRIVDFYDLANGSLRSADMRMLALPVLGDLQLNVVERLLGKEQTMYKHLPALTRINNAMNAGKWEDVRTVWTGLPKDIQDHRLFLKPYIAALSTLDDAAYQKMMAHYLGLYPDDAAAQVMGIDFYYLRKKWPQCRTAIVAVEKRAGSDAWFDMLRGSVALGEDKPAEVRKSLALALEKEPTLKDPYFMLIDLALGEKKWAEVSKWMLAAGDKLGVEFDVKAKGFEAFAASKEGKAYARRGTPAPVLEKKH